MSGVLLLGIGNILLGDDGLGTWFVNAFSQRYQIPPNLEVIEGGTLGLELLDCIAGRPGLVVVDAVNTPNAKAGGVTRLEGRSVPAALRSKLSTHDIALSDLLAAATLLDCLPDAVVLCGIAPARIAPQIALSPVVRAALPALEQLVLGELARLGCACGPSANGDTRGNQSSAPISRSLWASMFSPPGAQPMEEIPRIDSIQSARRLV